MYRQLEKRVKQQYLLHITYSHNMVNFGPLTPEIGWRVRGTQQISTGRQREMSASACTRSMLGFLLRDLLHGTPYRSLHIHLQLVL